MATVPDPTPPTVFSSSATSPETAPPSIGTLAELRAAGHEQRSLREEIRANLLAALAAGRNPWPGLHGFDRTVIPQLERALIAGHDVVLLGERGQGKTRLLRTLSGLLDEWSPVIAGSELNEHPYEPLTSESRARAARDGGRLPVAWRHRSERYVEKLSTPDTSVADLIGDVDPMRVAEGRRLGDPETIHYGLVPRSNRGIVALNELPDLAERIQVALLNVMEERDIQIRGYVLRLPLDVLVVASANPEDYTNRGRIITPLKDRFGAEIRTHYPRELDHEIAVIRQEARLTAEVPDVVLEILARFTRALRSSSAVNQSSGVSARFAIAGAETVAAAARHRAIVRGDEPVARLVDLESAAEVLGGKIEFESGEEGREDEILEHLLRTATAQTVREHFAGLDFAPLVDAFDGHRTTTTGERVTAAEFLADLPELEDPTLYDEIDRRLRAPAAPDSSLQTDSGGGPTAGDLPEEGSTAGDLTAGDLTVGHNAGGQAPGASGQALGHRAGAIELALEGLYLARELSKESDDGQTIYG
ncbi:sigma 54-interacting transcriptional regulator [Citricoccus zhacaiensis]